MFRLYRGPLLEVRRTAVGAHLSAFENPAKLTLRLETAQVSRSSRAKRKLGGRVASANGNCRLRSPCPIASGYLCATHNLARSDSIVLSEPIRLYEVCR